MGAGSVPLDALNETWEDVILLCIEAVMICIWQDRKCCIVFPLYFNYFASGCVDKEGCRSHCRSKENIVTGADKKAHNSEICRMRAQMSG